MPKQVAAHSETLNKRCGKRNSPKKLRRITTYKSLYGFLLDILDTLEPRIIRNAGLINFVQKFCWEVPNWGYNKNATYYLYGMIWEVGKDQSSEECSKALFSYFENLLD